MVTTLSFSPLMRQRPALRSFDDIMGRYVQASEADSAFPAYNIEKRGDESYAIVLAVLGLGEDQLKITQEGQTLTISGQATPLEGVEYLYKGLELQSFERQFTLGEHIKVEGAQLRHGLLSVMLRQELPEAAKPRTIPIS